MSLMQSLGSTVSPGYLVITYAVRHLHHDYKLSTMGLCRWTLISVLDFFTIVIVSITTKLMASTIVWSGCIYRCCYLVQIGGILQWWLVQSVRPYRVGSKLPPVPSPPTRCTSCTYAGSMPCTQASIASYARASSFQRLKVWTAWEGRQNKSLSPRFWVTSPMGNNKKKSYVDMAAVWQSHLPPRWCKSS